MSALALRRGTVSSVEAAGPATRLTVDVGGEQRPAIAYERLTGPVAAGDDVVVNVAGRDLGLGSGGFDIVHVNLTRGLDGTGAEGAHVMKLNYSSLQHAVHPVEERTGDAGDQVLLGLPLQKPVAVISLHGQLPCVAWAAAQARPGIKVGFVQTAGGALPGSLSDVVRDLIERELLCGHVTAAPAFDGEHEAISAPGGIHAGLTELGWDACIAGPGPGILGSATALGHGGLAGLDTAHAALSLGCRTIVVPRMSSGDARPRHQGLSHHTATVLELLLRPALVAVPAGALVSLPGEHEARAAEVDLEGYAESQLPARTMGRSIEEDELFFRAALAGGVVLVEESGL
ncbi:MAG: hypothetical protein QOE06_2971 [Thermoleophilaceae bacterium]|nr:hypothetical protein [Thermoleophilaceae bacterium]